LPPLPEAMPAWIKVNSLLLALNSESDDVEERGMSGYDVKLSGQAPYLSWAKIKGTYYHWDATTGPNIKGNILGIDIELTPSVSFEFGQENNNTMG
jgi:hypothetical protein